MLNANTPAWYSVLAEITAIWFYLAMLNLPARSGFVPLAGGHHNGRKSVSGMQPDSNTFRSASILSEKQGKYKSAVRMVILAVLVVIHILYFQMLPVIYPVIGRWFMAGTILLFFSYFAAGYQDRWHKRMYYAIHAFVLSEFLASMAWSVYLFVIYRHIVLPLPAEVGLVTVEYMLVYVLLWKLERPAALHSRILPISGAALGACCFIGIGTYLVSGLSVDLAAEALTGEHGMAVFGIRTLIDLAGVIMLYAQTMQLYNAQMSQENYAIHTLLENQARQYRFSQECIDQVNMKYHDLKQQINRWKLQADNAGQEHYLEQLSRQVGQFDLRVDSGNPAIDIIMTEKMLACADHRITLTMVIDGKALAFMEESDLCSVFGNAVDNAIEYEEKVEEENKRIIHVTAHRVQKFVLILFENYCETPVSVAENGLPQTTKQDKLLHGYGLRSIRYIVSRYDGQSDISQEDGWFRLKILIPVKA